MNTRLRVLYTGVALAVMTAISCAAQGPVTTPVTSPDYDLILKGGHVIDAKNNIDGVMDVAIKDGLDREGRDGYSGDVCGEVG